MKPSWSIGKGTAAWLLTLPFLGVIPGVVQAQIRTDGTLGGPARTLNGPSFQIPQSLGQLSGNNLFYSFLLFNIGSGESATFMTTKAGLANVISRVTGGSPSQIDGPINLQSANAAPNFFFINPAGVVFGEGAAINVPAGFYVSTANYLKFPDGNFYVDPKAVSTLSSAAPEAFGFLGTTRASIAIEGAKVNLQTTSPNADQPIEFVAGDIEINGATVQTNGSDIRVIAVGSNAQEVGLFGALPVASGNLSMVNGALVTTNEGGNILVSAGNVTINGGAAISATTTTSGNAGAVTVNAGALVIDGSGNSSLTGIDSQTLHNTGKAGNAGDVNVTVSGMLSILSGGEISTSTFTSGAGGTVTVRAGTLVIDGGSNTKFTGIDSEALSQTSDTEGLGNAGNVYITVAGTLSVRNGGEIAADTFTSGAGGTITVNAGTLVIDGSGGNSNFTGIASGTDSNSSNGGKTGNAGDVTVTSAGALSILNGGVGGGGITTTTHTSGNAGVVTVKAGTLVIDGSSSNYFTGIASEADSDSINGGKTGNAGGVNVTVAGALSVLNGGEINTSTYSSGNGGAVSVNAATVTIDGGSGSSFTGIASDAVGTSVNGGETGNAGDVAVVVNGALSLHNSGTIATDTFTSGSAGAVTVNARTISADSNGLIGAIAHAGSSGQTGTVTVQVSDSIALSDHASFSITNDAAVAQPGSLTPTQLTVTAPNISLTNGAQITAASSGNIAASDIRVSFGPQLTVDNALISTKAFEGNGGSVTVSGTGTLYLKNGQITTTVTGQEGNGGDINIQAPNLVLQTGFIQANTAAKNASGGDVKIEVSALVPSGSTLFQGGSKSYDYMAGVFGFNVIQAAAPNGVSGVPQISAPVLNLIGSISALPTEFLDSGGFGRSPCAIPGGSSLSLVGRGGLPPKAGDLLWVDPGMEVPATPPAGAPGSGMVVPRYRPVGGSVRSKALPCLS